MTTTFDVPDISCGSCVAHIEKAIGGLDGVGAVNVDVAAKTVTVDGAADAHVLHAALTAAGYPPAD